MAVNIPSLNVNAIGEGLKDQNNYEAILDILQRYRKELNFYLMNLDLDNMPAVAEDIDWIHQDIDGVKITVGNNAGDIAALSVRADEISASVGDNAGDIAALVVTAAGIQSQVTDNKTNIATVTQTAQGIQTQVSNNAGDISSLTQTAQGIQTQVSSHDTLLGTHSSQITQLGNSISSKVSYTDYNGNTITSKINQTATTIKLEASKIDLTGITRIYSPRNPADDYFSFYGNGVALYENGISRLQIFYDATKNVFAGAPISFDDGVYFDGPVDFSNASVTGLTMKFA